MLKAVWDSYVIYWNPHSMIFGLLRDQYANAIRRVLKLTGRVEVDHLVAKRLVRTVESKPRLTVECLSGMVDGVKEICEILGWV